MDDCILELATRVVRTGAPHRPKLEERTVSISTRIGERAFAEFQHACITENLSQREMLELCISFYRANRELKARLQRARAKAAAEREAYAQQRRLKKSQDYFRRRHGDIL